MARRKRKRNRKRPEAMTFHLVHRSQRDPLAANPDAPQLVLVPNVATEEALKAKTAAANDLGGTVMRNKDFSALPPAQYGYEYEYEYGYSDDNDEDGGDSKGQEAGPSSSSSNRMEGSKPSLPKTRDGRVHVAAMHADADADVDGSVVDNYAYNAYFAGGRGGGGGDMYDYSQHLRVAGGADATFVSPYGRPAVPDVTVFKPAVELTPSVIDEVTGLPADVLASKFEEDVGLLNLAAPVPEGFRTDLPLDVLRALEDADVVDEWDEEFEELQDDFIQVASSQVPLDANDGFEETQWALEYTRVMDPAKYADYVMSQSEAAGGYGYLPNDITGGEEYLDYSSDDGGNVGSDAGMSTASKYVSVVPVYGTPFSVASTVNRPRAGMLEVEDERLEVMMEKMYEPSQIGDLDNEFFNTRGHLKLEDFDSMIDDVLKGKILRSDFKRDVLLAPVKDTPELRERILAAAQRQDDADAEAAAAAAASGVPDDPIERILGHRFKPRPVEHDAVSVLSFSSNVSNHPRKIRSIAPKARPGKARRIVLDKAGIPSLADSDDDNDQPTRDHDQEDGGDEGEGEEDEYELVVLEGVKRPKNETKAEKKARKKRVKEAKRMARQRKKATRLEFKEENKIVNRKAVPTHGNRPGTSIIRY